MQIDDNRGIEVGLYGATERDQEGQAEHVPADRGILAGGKVQLVEFEQGPVVIRETKLEGGVNGEYGKGDKTNPGLFGALQVDQRALGGYFDRDHASLLLETRETRGKLQLTAGFPGDFTEVRR